MNIKKPENSNYCGTIVEITDIIFLDNCDNVCHTTIFGNLVIISKDVKLGDKGVFFPVEVKLSHEFLSSNNLYRDNQLNNDKTKKGYFENNGRIRCVKFRGNKSEGLWLPIGCIYNMFFDIGKLPIGWNNIGVEFDELNGVKICEKYVIKRKQSQGKINRSNKSVKGFNVLLDGQFRFHFDTSQLYKNLYNIKSDDIISITLKMHGTSIISSNILTKRKLNFFEYLLKKLGVKIQDIEYRNIYSSRKIIKNKFLYSKNKKVKHYYKEDIWGVANKIIFPHLQKGQTVYAEVVGYLSNNSYIQKGFDYGCEVGKFDIYIYRITSTNFDGDTIEWSMKMIQDWCAEKGLNVVPELYYGYVSDLYKQLLWLWRGKRCEDGEFDSEEFLELLKSEYLEKDSKLCKNKVPEEGIVLRVEKYNICVYKLKSTRFLELETKNLDKGEINIEDDF